MANITIEVRNADKIIQACKNFPNIFAEEVNMGIGRLGWEVVTMVKENIRQGVDMWKPPIDTGTMMRGIFSQQVSPTEAYIMPSVITPYATYVHEGTRRMKARPYFDITAKKDAAKVEEKFNMIMEKIVRRLTV